MTITYEFGYLRKDNTYHIRLLIVNGRGKENRKRVSTNIYVNKKDVGTKTTRGKKQLVIKNEVILSELEMFIANAKKDYLASSGLIQQKESTQAIVNIVTKNDTSTLPTFFEYAEKWMSDATIKGLKNYRTMINSFKAFTNDDLTFNDITPVLLEKYKKSLKDRPRALTMYLGGLRHLWMEARRQYKSLMPPSPFEDIDIPRQAAAKKRAVNMELIRTIYNTKCEPGTRKELARDCYIMSFCLMGMNSVDLYNCSVLEDNTLKYERTKTKERRLDNAYIEVRIPDIITHLINKYKGTDGRHVFNFAERYGKPEDFNRALNIGLKDIADGLQFYSARHSWATIGRNDIKASKYDINEGLNHVDHDMDITDIYIKKDFSVINELNEQIIKYVFG